MTTKPTKNDPPSAGFIIVERVLHEFRDTNASVSLDQFRSQLEKGLERFKADNTSPRATKEAQAVEAAMGCALELVQTLRSDARNKPKS